MKLSKSNEPFPQDHPPADPESKAEDQPKPTTKRVIHRPLLDRQRASAAGATAPGLGPGSKSGNPGQRLRAFEEAATGKPAKLPLKYRLRPDRKKTRYAFWDIAAIFSLIFNAVLLALLLIMAGQVKTLKQAISSGLLGGLYGSFVEMDRASIITTIQVDAQLPLNFTLPVQQNTDVTLTRNTSIPGAYVIINSQLFNISAPANVTLPSGTKLPIALNLDIPVQVTLPISLQVPVNIPLASTGLHGPFTGLQQAIRPYYCMLEPDAQYPQGTFVCKQPNPPVLTPGAP